jgi:hypothetical protein
MRNECFVAAEEVGELSERPTDACADISVPVLLEIATVFVRVCKSLRKVELDVGSDSRRCPAVLMASCSDCYSYPLGFGVFQGKCYLIFVGGVHDQSWFDAILMFER